MLDPLTALGLAASVAQFVDFGTRIMSQTYQIRQGGSSIGTAHLQIVTSDLHSLTTNITERYRALESDDLLSREEQSLRDLAAECAETAQELGLALLKVSRQSRCGKWDSVCVALRTVWQKDKVDQLAEQLGTFREQLTLRLLVVLNAQNSLNGEKLDLIDHRSQEIVEVLSIQQQTLESTILDQKSSVKSYIQEQSFIASKRHEEIVGAILTMKNGEFRTMEGQENGQMNNSPSGTGSTSCSTTIYGKYNDGKSYHSSSQRLAQESDIRTTELLRSLAFPTMTDRREVVVPAYQKTFSWIFGDPGTHGKPWDSFVSWLESGYGCYWIQGKAGSGKSTLMKFIEEDSRTQEALHNWRTPEILVSASHFFWNAGTELQKSQAGLLRSLLFDVVKQRPNLAPALFPERFHPDLFHGSAVSFGELKRAFTILALGPMKAQFCFFIDGLDEYHGDHNELTSLLITASSSKSVKFVLSSRPIPACVQAFKDSPGLRLQDLTNDDIKTYIDGKLLVDPLMQRMECHENGATSHLVDEITSKASGVFLWVHLVVKSLLNGLQNYDRLGDLLLRLDELPADLEKLYRHMLRSVSPIYQRQASIIFQLVMKNFRLNETNNRTDMTTTMTLLQLSFTEDENLNEALNATIEPISIAEELARCETTEGRLRSRCCGLVEVQELEAKSLPGPLRKYVGFLHRTVLEFLQDVQVWHGVLSMTAETAFDIDRVLMRSLLLEMKRKPPDLDINGRYGASIMSRFKSQAWRNMVQCLYALRDESLRHSVTRHHVQILKEIRRVMDFYFPGDLGPEIPGHWAWTELHFGGYGGYGIGCPKELDPWLLLLLHQRLIIHFAIMVRETPLQSEKMNLMLISVILNCVTHLSMSGRTSTTLNDAINELLRHDLNLDEEVILSASHLSFDDPWWGRMQLRFKAHTKWAPLQFLSYLMLKAIGTGSVSPERCEHWTGFLFAAISVPLEGLISRGANIYTTFQDEGGCQHSTLTVLKTFLTAIEDSSTFMADLQEYGVFNAYNRLCDLLRGKGINIGRGAAEDSSTARPSPQPQGASANESLMTNSGLRVSVRPTKDLKRLTRFFTRRRIR